MIGQVAIFTPKGVCKDDTGSRLGQFAGPFTHVPCIFQGSRTDGDSPQLSRVDLRQRARGNPPASPVELEVFDPSAYFRIGLVLIDILRPTFNPEIGDYPAIIGDFLE